MKLFKRRTNILLSFLILGALYILFDAYINNIAKESLSNWLKVEEFSIAEGNLLTSVTKNQRMLLSSEFIKGVVLLDFSRPLQMEQIEFGEKISPKVLNKDITGIELERVGFFHRYVYAKIPHQEDMMIVFSVWSKGLFNVFLIACALFATIFVFYSFVIDRIKKEEFKLREKQTIDYANKAARAAHDIRSPLLILNSLIDAKNQGTFEFRQQLTNVIGSLKAITQELVDERSTVVKPKPIEVKSIKAPLSVQKEIELLIENKKLQYEESGIDISCSLSNASSHLKIEVSELRRSLSNIIDNSFDAISGKGEITVTSKERDGFYLIEVKDSGKGIPGSMLSAIGTKGFTFGKEKGSGMGVHYTKEGLETIGGFLEIQSQENQGTTVTLGIPLSKCKLVSDKLIQIESDSKVFVLDDSPSIHAAWKILFEKHKISDKLEISYFSKPKEILEAEIEGNIFLLTDYDLQDTLDGLDVASSMGLSKNSLLITGAADDVNVQAKAYRAGIPVLSKDALPELQIVIV